MHETDATPRWALPLGLLAVLFYTATFVTPLGSPDFYWHANTGRWIAAHHALPSIDPFTHTADPLGPDAGHTRLYLRAYWLADVLFYGLFAGFGATGVILFKALLHGGLVLGILLWGGRTRPGPWPLASAVLLGSLLGGYANERPQVFTFLFLPVALYLLEEIAQERDRRRLWKLGGLLAALLLLWGNLHGGVLLGLGVLLLHGLGQAVERRREPGAFWAAQGAALGVAALFAFANPNGPFLLADYLTNVWAGGGSIHELTPPWRALVERGEPFLPYWLYLALAAQLVVSRRRAVAPRHVLVTAGLAALSLTALRHLPLPLLAAPLLAPYAPEWSRRTASRLGGAIALSAVALAALTWRGAPLRFGESAAFPSRAVAALADLPPQGNVFNYYDWGGYVAWKLPGRKVFIDGRNASAEAAREYEAALWGVGWREIFDRRGVDVVLLPGLSASTGEIYALVYALIEAPDWGLVEADETALLFVRDTPELRPTLIASALPVRVAFERIARRAAALEPVLGRNKELWYTQAQVFIALKDWAGAQRALEAILSLDPNDREARDSLRQVREMGGFGPGGR